MDSFFASIEKRDRPELKHRPVIIGADPKGGKGRGVVSTCCYIARKYGIHSAMPISVAYRLCPDGIYLRPDIKKYRKVSGNIMAILMDFADKFQQVSVDEAFLDVSERVKYYASPKALAIEIKKEIFLAEHLTCSIGIATSKSIAKIASDMNKPNGITVVPPGSEIEFLAPLPVEKISGIGQKTRILFEKNGIRTIGELAEAEEEFLRERIGDFAVGFKYIAMGLDTRQVQPRDGIESISTERTFMVDTHDEEVILNRLREMGRHVHQRLIGHGLLYRTVGIKVRFEDFITHTRERSLNVPVNTLSPIIINIQELWKEFSPPPKKVRLLGVKLSGLRKERLIQTTLDKWTRRKNRA